MCPHSCAGKLNILLLVADCMHYGAGLLLSVYCWRRLGDVQSVRFGRCGVCEGLAVGVLGLLSQTQSVWDFCCRHCLRC